MVRNVKSALKRCLGKALVSKVELESLLFEIENVVNSRPLTQVTDVLENQRPICPNDFLMVKDLSPCKEEAPMIQGNYGRSPLVEMYNHKQKLLQKFWEIWASNYIRNLPKVVPHQTERNTIKKGSIVLVEEDGITRLQWPMGRVVEVYPGKDKRVRSVRIKTSKGEIVRPVNRLCHLEGVTISSTEDLFGVDDSNYTQDNAVNISEDSAPDGEVPSKVTTTTSGRRVKPPSRLDV